MSKNNKAKAAAKSTASYSELQKLILEARAYYNTKYNQAPAQTSRDIAAILKQSKEITGQLVVTKDNRNFVAGIVGGIDGVPQAELAQLIITALSLIGIPAKKDSKKEDAGSNHYFTRMLVLHKLLADNPDYKAGSEPMTEEVRKMLAEFSEFHSAIATPKLLEQASTPNGLTGYIIDLPLAEKIDLSKKLLGFLDSQMLRFIKIAPSITGGDQKDLYNFLKIIAPNLSTQLKAAQKNFETAGSIADDLLRKINKMFNTEETLSQKSASSLLGETKFKELDTKTGEIISPQPKLAQKPILGFIQEPMQVAEEFPSPSSSASSYNFSLSPSHNSLSPNYPTESYFLPVTYLLPIDHPDIQNVYGLIPSSKGLAQLVGYPPLPIHPALDQNGNALLPITYNMHCSHPDAQLCYGLMDIEDWIAITNNERLDNIIRAPYSLSLDSHSFDEESFTSSASLESEVASLPSLHPSQTEAKSIAQERVFSPVAMFATIQGKSGRNPIVIDKTKGFCMMDIYGKLHRIVQDVESGVIEVYKGDKIDSLKLGQSFFPEQKDEKDFTVITIEAQLEDGRIFPVKLHKNTTAIILDGEPRFVGPDTESTTEREKYYKLTVEVTSKEKFIDGGRC